MTAATPWTISRSAIGSMERGRSFPSLEALLAYWDVLQVEPMEVLERARLAMALPDGLGEANPDEPVRRPRSSSSRGERPREIAIHRLIAERPRSKSSEDPDPHAMDAAAVELRRAESLRRSSALLSARAAVERAIVASDGEAAIRAEAYGLLALLHFQLGNGPLALDAARMAGLLSEGCGDPTRARVLAAVGEVLSEVGRHEEARQAFLECRDKALCSGDEVVATLAEGGIGVSMLARQRAREAKVWIARAVGRARKHVLRAQEARWLIELGRAEFLEGKLDQATALAQRALSLARKEDDPLLAFRAEWLLHLVHERRNPGEPDRVRLGRLRKLLLRLEEHRGHTDVQELKALLLSGTEVGMARS